jgi:hypothetical protein
MACLSGALVRHFFADQPPAEKKHEYHGEIPLMIEHLLTGRQMTQIKNTDFRFLLIPQYFE